MKHSILNLNKINAITPTEYSRYIFIDRLLKGLKGTVKNACDIGCGVGNLLSVLEGHDINFKGIDISSECIELAKNRVNSSRIQFENKNIFELNEQFDLVYLLEVLEHIDDDKGLLDFLYRKIVRRGGYLILTVPAHSFLYSDFDKGVGHLRRYDKKALASLLESHKFKPIVFWSFGSILFHIIANLSTTSKGDSGLTRHGIDFQQRTSRSAIREFPPVHRFFVSRVNLMHRIFFLLDCLVKNFDFGIDYCVLCKSY